jgi:hypothetical protein
MEESPSLDETRVVCDWFSVESVESSLKDPLEGKDFLNKKPPRASDFMRREISLLV